MFFVSLILTAISVTIMIFSKYQTQKRHWGIYLSLGMSKNNIMQYVFSEIFIY
ncbi:FtsX-like permease family protein, partial [Agathobacter rectalis]|uniref:FtsX-like permease family protein n=1 Tax=Agathobacter rectalis TaxID=39491 RepID=UPI003A84441C